MYLYYFYVLSTFLSDGSISSTYFIQFLCFHIWVFLLLLYLVILFFNREVLQRQAECYIRAIQWNLHYYYHGCPSWSWYYPYHYAPFISDIKDFTRLGQLDFELGMPFQPFQQLLGVLPPGR